MTLMLTSDDFADGALLHERHSAAAWGHHGDNLSPHLAWSGAPAGTRSFALTMYDPDLSSDSGWWHWLVIDIPADVDTLETGASTSGRLPGAARQMRNDVNEWRYLGPAPDEGMTNTYVWRLHALDVETLDLEHDASAAMVSGEINAHSLARAQLVGQYRKQ